MCATTSGLCCSGDRTQVLCMLGKPSTNEAAAQPGLVHARQAIYHRGSGPDCFSGVDTGRVKEKSDPTWILGTRESTEIMCRHVQVRGAGRAGAGGRRPRHCGKRSCLREHCRERKKKRRRQSYPKSFTETGCRQNEPEG